MPELVVCEGATCLCSMGSSPSTLVVTSQTIETIDGMIVATVDDYVTETNIPSFGLCTILTDDADGTPTPCVPVLSAPWSPGSSIRTINDLALLTASCTLACSIGGSISIDDANNEIAQTD